MAHLTFICPYTTKPISSGIEIEPKQVKRVGAFPIDIYCPHCKCYHHGVIADGIITPRPEDTAA